MEKHLGFDRTKIIKGFLNISMCVFVGVSHIGCNPNAPEGVSGLCSFPSIDLPDPLTKYKETVPVDNWKKIPSDTSIVYGVKNNGNLVGSIKYSFDGNNIIADAEFSGGTHRKIIPIQINQGIYFGVDVVVGPDSMQIIRTRGFRHCANNDWETSDTGSGDSILVPYVSPDTNG